jgi:hypothetical protein
MLVQDFALLFEQPSDHCSTASLMLKSPNEKTLSDGHRGRASLEVETF